MQQSILPEWVQWIAALAPTALGLVTACAAIAVAIVSYRQWRAAREKLLIDLFDKRFELFVGIDQITDQVAFRPGTWSKESDKDVLRRTVFLFGPDVQKSVSELMTCCIDTEQQTNPILRKEMVKEMNEKFRKTAHLMRPYMQMTQRL